MNAALRPLPLVGRILLALIFVLAGINKMSTTGATASYMASHGIPLSNILVYGVIGVELVGGLMLMLGLYARCAAGVLCLYTLALAVIFHPFWAVPGAQAALQHAMFFEHLSMMGGMLFVVAFGAGPMSLDAMRRHGVEGWDSGPTRVGDHPIGRAQ